MPNNAQNNALYYGDNLDVLRRKIRDETIDLCYIDPPFNSKRTYNQIYNNVGTEDRAQTQAFIDTWTWDDRAIAGYQEILSNDQGRFTSQTVDLLKGLQSVLKNGGLLAYLVSMTLRITEIQRVLKPTGSFYLHCDPTASHYLKLMTDTVFCPQGGDFQNEIIWRRTGSHNATKSFGSIHDVILVYNKTMKYRFNIVRRPYMKRHVEERYTRQPDGQMKFTSGGNVLTGAGATNGDSGKVWRGFDPTSKGRHWAVPKFYESLMPDEYRDLQSTEKLEALYQTGLVEIDGTSAWPSMVRFLEEREGVPLQDLWAYQPYTEGTVWNTKDGIDADVAWHGPTDPDRLGYQTQKPEGLLERIIAASTNENDVVLDAYCGCGTTVAVAEKLKRRWIGIDITYQSIALMLSRLEGQYGKDVLSDIILDGIPSDIASAYALAHKQDDRVRKEFEKWAVLTYTNNRAIINQKKGADGGIDGIAYFLTSHSGNAKIVFQVKSGKVGRGDIAKLRGDMQRESAAMAVFITLEPPTAPMAAEAKAAGRYHHEIMDRSYDTIEIVTIQDIIDRKKELSIPLNFEVIKSAQRKATDTQMPLMEEVAG